MLESSVVIDPYFADRAEALLEQPEGYTFSVEIVVRVTGEIGHGRAFFELFHADRAISLRCEFVRVERNLGQRLDLPNFQINVCHL